MAKLKIHEKIIIDEWVWKFYKYTVLYFNIIIMEIFCFFVSKK